MMTHLRNLMTGLVLAALASCGPAFATTVPQLPVASTPLTGTECMWGEQSGTKQVCVNQILSVVGIANTASIMSGAVLAGPVSGSPGAYSFRALAKTDLPILLSDASKTTAAMVSGPFTIGHLATFSDVNGTLTDGGPVGGGGGGVSSFMSRTGAVVLVSGDVTSALGFTTMTLTGANVVTGNNTHSGIETFAATPVARRTVNSNTTLSAATDNIVCGDVSGGAIAITMPPGTGSAIANGTPLSIDDCKRQSASHTLTINANAGQTISGAASTTITTNGAAINAVWNSTDNDWNLF